jgi:hypothetical protein
MSVADLDVIAPAEAFSLLLHAEYAQEPNLADEIIASGRAWFWRMNRPERSRVDDDLVVRVAEAALKKLRDNVKTGAIALYGSFQGDQSKQVPPGDQTDGDLDVFGRRLELFKKDDHEIERVYTSVFCRRADVMRLIGPAADRGNASKSTRSRPARDRASEAIAALYPAGVPSQADLPNDRLYDAVLAHLKATGKLTVDKTTVLRAAKRRGGTCGI